MGITAVSLLALNLVGAAQRQQGEINPITSRDDLARIMKVGEPTVIMFNSATCQACDVMKKELKPVMKKYLEVDFYSVESTNDAFKGIAKELNIKAYPTTHFIKKGITTRKERGSMGESEIERAVYKLVHNKDMPLPKPPKQKKTEPKEAA